MATTAQLRISGASRACGLLVAILVVAGCRGDEFACGEGECQEGEVCVIGGSDRCSTCVPAPAECSTCDCLPPASDEAFGSARCIDGGTCTDDDEEGAVVTCEQIDWGCG